MRILCRQPDINGVEQRAAEQTSLPLRYAPIAGVAAGTFIGFARHAVPLRRVWMKSAPLCEAGFSFAPLNSINRMTQNYVVRGAGKYLLPMLPLVQIICQVVKRSFQNTPNFRSLPCQIFTEISTAPSEVAMAAAIATVAVASSRLLPAWLSMLSGLLLQSSEVDALHASFGQTYAPSVEIMMQVSLGIVHALLRNASVRGGNQKMARVLEFGGVGLGVLNALLIANSAFMCHTAREVVAGYGWTAMVLVASVIASRPMTVADLSPDLLTLVGSGAKLLEINGTAVPLALTALTPVLSISTALLLPGLMTGCVGLIKQATSRGWKLPRLDHSVNISYLSVLLATVIAIVIDATKSSFAVPEVATKFSGVFLPWAGYLLRVPILLQIPDVVQGYCFNRKLTDLIETDRPPQEILGGNYKASWKNLGVQRERAIAKLMSDSDSYVSRANGGGRGAELRKLKDDLSSRFYSKRRDGKASAATFKVQSARYVRKQALGLIANVFAVLSMLPFAAPAAAPTLSFLSGVTYLVQTTGS